MELKLLSFFNEDILWNWVFQDLSSKIQRDVHFEQISKRPFSDFQIDQEI